MSESKGIDHLIGQRIWSESVYADCVSPDGSAGLMLRLCRYPNQETAWLWAFAFLPGRIYSYNDHYLPCPDEISQVESPDLTYEQAGPVSAVFRRDGSRDTPQGAHVSISVKGHRGPRAPHGQGGLPMTIEADLVPEYPPYRPNKYRSEWIGKVRAVLTVEGETIEIQGLGHWHEQHQKAPRWVTPFTYISLRGPDLALVGTAMEADNAGFAVGPFQTTSLKSIEIDPPNKRRGLRLVLKDDTVLDGSVTTVHDYLVPIYRANRPGTLVTARIGEHRLSGCVNDWYPES